MPVAYNAAVVEAQFRYTFNDEQMLNTLWFDWGGGGPVSIGAMSALGTLLFNWWDGSLKPLQALSCQLREIYLRQAIADPALTYTYVPASTAVGTVTGDPLPGNVSLSVSFRTGLSGRSYRGRNYTLGMVEGQQTAGQVSVGYYDDILAAYQQLQIDIADDGLWGWIVYSQYSDGAPRAAGVATTINSVIIVDNDTDSQRRRNRGVGA